VEEGVLYMINGVTESTSRGSRTLREVCGAAGDKTLSDQKKRGSK
jgi:hypothetical protein